MKVVLTNVKKNFKGRTVVDIDSLEFERGKIYAVLGPNGSGKTTMLRIISGNEQPEAGIIHYDGSLRVTENISYLPQENYLFDMSVMRNMLLALGKTRDSKDKALKALENVNMKEFAETHAKSLSGGEARRVAVARVLALEKQLVLLDEPAAAIDNISAELVESYISRMNRQTGATIIFSTHNPSQAERIADEAVMMWNGRIIEKGKPLKIFNSPDKEETKMFLKNWRIK